MKRILHYLLPLLLVLLCCVKAGAFTINLNIDHPDYVFVQVGVVDTWTDLTPGDNAVEVDPGDPYIFFMDVDSDHGLTAVYNDQNEDIKVYNASSYYIKLSEADAGKTFRVVTFEAQPDICTATVNVDDASMVKFFIGDNSMTPLNNGANTITFDSRETTTFRLKPADYFTPFHMVKIDGREIAWSFPEYVITNVRNGSVIDIITKLPEGSVDITITGNDAGLESVTAVKVDGKAIEDWSATGTVAVPIGSFFEISCDTKNYFHDSFTVDGVRKAFYGTYDATVIAPFTIDIQAHVRGIISFTLVVDDPENLDVYPGSYVSESSVPFEIKAGENKLTVKESAPYICFAARPECFIESVTDEAGNTYSNYASVTEGKTITVKTKRIIRDREAIIYVDDAGYNNSWYLADANAAKKELTSGYQTLNFAEEESPFTFYAGNVGGSQIYLNDNLLQGDLWDRYETTLGDGDVLKFFLKGEPAIRTAEVIATEGLEYTLYKDLIVPIEVKRKLRLQDGTMITIVPAEGTLMYVTAGDKKIEADEKGNFNFALDNDMAVRISDTPSGLAELTVDEAADTTVYNLQGMPVGTSLEELPAGVYIRGGVKVYVK